MLSAEIMIIVNFMIMNVLKNESINFKQIKKKLTIY